MSANTKIEWADHTFNPWIGCTKVSPGCDNCYAEQRMDKRLHVVQWGAGQDRKRTKTWGDPVKWNAQHEAFFALHGRRQRVFCASLADVFDNQVPSQWRNDLFRLISLTPNLDWLLLTKRIGNVVRLLDDALLQEPLIKNGECRAGSWPWPNVWLGITVVNQEEADRDIPKLLAIPAAKRFLSMEPLLGPVDLTCYHDWLGRSVGGMWCPDCPEDGVGIDPEEHQHCHGEVVDAAAYSGIDWVIVGGESGPNARPMHPDWARSLRDQCQAAGVPFLFKQWGEWLPWAHFGDAAVDDPPEQTRFKTMEFVDSAWVDVGYPDYWATMDGEIDDMQCVGRVGKKAAGRLLDGRTWDGLPA